MTRTGEADPVAPRALPALDRLFAPAGVALVGASATPGSIADRQYRALAGAPACPELYLVNPNRAEIDGRRTYRSLADLPVTPDVAIVLVRDDLVHAVVEQAVAIGVPFLVVGSSGFEGPAAAPARERLLAALRGSATRMVGPNSEGLVDWGRRVPLTFNAVAADHGRPDHGGGGGPRIGVVSQSGALAFAALAALDDRGARPGPVVSTGNELDLDLCDFVEHCATAGDCQVVVLVVESIGDVARFVRTADAARAAGCRLVALRLGTTVAGRAAVESHTGRAATPGNVGRAVFARCGIAEADDLDTLMALASVGPAVGPSAVSFAGSSSASSVARGGRRVAVVSAAGGPAILATEHLLGAGLSVAPLTAPLRESILDLLPGYASAANPVDLTAQVALNVTAARVVGLLQDAPEVDGVLLVGSLGYRDLSGEHWRTVLGRRSEPVVIWSYTAPSADNRALLRRTGTPWAATARAAARTMAAVLRPAPAPEVAGFPPEVAGAAGGPPRDFRCAAAALDAAGIAVVRTVDVADARQAGETAAAIVADGGPVVVKALPAGFGQKTDWGGVLTHLRGRADTGVAFDTVARAATAAGHTDRGYGIVVQPQLTGHEVLVGAVDHGGTVLTAVGSGGVLADLAGDAEFRLAPIDHDTAVAWLGELAVGRRVAAGFRNLPPCPLAGPGGLADLVSRFSRWTAGLGGGWSSIELNPVIVSPAGAVVVDIRLTT